MVGDGFIESAVGHAPKRLRVVGGGQKNPLWLQLKADITGLPVEITTNPEVTLLGVAILAGIGAGFYKDIHDAVSQVKFTTEDFSPDQNRHEAYRAHFEKVYTPLPTALQSVYGEVERLM